MNKQAMINLKAFLILIIVLSGHSTAQVANIDAGNVKQYIDGFGASTAWHGQLTEAEADAAFSNDHDNQMGLSILRIRIDPDGNYKDELLNGYKAMSRGAIVFASPWNAPSDMVETIGDYKRIRYDKYEDYAYYLDDFNNHMNNFGMPLYAISVQNEPDWNGGWNQWTAEEMHTFMRNYASIIGTRVMAPESFQFRREMSDPILYDSVACANLDIVGGHIYGGGLVAYPLAEEKGKKIWMTEHFINEDDLNTCIDQFAKEIIDCMYNNMNAFIWWYLRQPDCNLIYAGGSLKKKGYIMAHFSKFIRPGYHRIDATYRPQSRVYLVAFQGEDIVLVVINQNSTNINQTFTFGSDSIVSIQRYTTSGTKNLSNDGIIDIADYSFTTTLDARSITTIICTKAHPSDQSENILEQNYPNPFTSSTTILFNLPSKSYVQLKVYDMTGREVATLVDEELEAGAHSRLWNASNIASSVYFYQLQYNSFVETKKLLLLR